MRNTIENVNGQIAEGEMVIYTTQDGDVQVQVDTENETLWLTQKAMAQLFGVGVPAISKHLSNIFSEGELDAVSVISKMETTASDGKNYQTLSTISMPSSRSTVRSCSKDAEGLARHLPTRRWKRNTTNIAIESERLRG